jgi:hypothetical protein
MDIIADRFQCILAGHHLLSLDICLHLVGNNQ